VFVLCTPPPGATDLQMLPCSGRPLYDRWPKRRRGGPTGWWWAQPIPRRAHVRALAPQAWILLPGVGAQGGDLEGGVGRRACAMTVGGDRQRLAGIIYAAIHAERRSICGSRSARSGNGTGCRPTLRIAADPGPGRHRRGQVRRVHAGIRNQSPIYIDLRLLVFILTCCALAAHAYAGLIGGNMDEGMGEWVLGWRHPYAALPIGTAVALETGLR